MRCKAAGHMMWVATGCARNAARRRLKARLPGHARKYCYEFLIIESSEADLGFRGRGFQRGQCVLDFGAGGFQPRR